MDPFLIIHIDYLDAFFISEISYLQKKIIWPILLTPEAQAWSVYCRIWNFYFLYFSLFKNICVLAFAK